MEGLAPFVVVICLICAFIGGMIGAASGRTFLGIVLGLFFGPLGVFVIIGMKPRPQCRSCGQRMNLVDGREPTVCPFCHKPPRGTVPEPLIALAQEPKRVKFRCAGCTIKLEGRPGVTSRCPNCGLEITVPVP